MSENGETLLRGGIILPSMDMDFDALNRARLSRDRRFDGRFYVAVTSTGIYCRPVCPAPPPRLSNVRFYACAAAAEEAGYRPCRRCRPETAPGTPAWLGTSATVTRALRLISDGFLDHAGVESLARRLGIGDRHLRRLFLQHLGATPRAVAQTRRLHFARRLIDETDLSMSQVALASGFESLRRFNAAVKDFYGIPPSQLRRNPGGRSRLPGGSGFQFRLPYRPPMDWEPLLDFLARRAIPGVEVVEEGCYTRSIAVDGHQGLISVLHDAARWELLLQVRFPDFRPLLNIVERTRALFDLAAVPLEIASHLECDPQLRPLVRARPGLRVPGAWNGFELAVRAILGQQVTVRAASTIAGRLARRFGTPLLGYEDQQVSLLFPGPEALADADLSGVGVPAGRAATIRSLARAVCRGEASFDGSMMPAEVIEALSRLRGVGPWTTSYIAMRALREPDAFPAEDLGIRKALSALGGGATAGHPESRAEPWRPWRAYAAMHLWISLSNPGPGLGCDSKDDSNLNVTHVEKEALSDRLHRRPGPGGSAAVLPWT